MQMSEVSTEFGPLPDLGMVDQMSSAMNALKDDMKKESKAEFAKKA